jgi:hypothetical protein
MTAERTIDVAEAYKLRQAGLSDRQDLSHRPEIYVHPLARKSATRTSFVCSEFP